MTSPGKAAAPGWLVPAGLIMLSVVPVLAGAMRVAQLAGGAEVTPENARFFAAPLPVVVHIVGASLYCVLGALQFAPGLRRRRLIAPPKVRVAFIAPPKVRAAFIAPPKVRVAFIAPPKVRAAFSWHRVAGRLLVPCGLAAALSGLWMTLFYPQPPGDGDLLTGFRLVFGSAMVLSIGLGFAAVRRRDITRHRAWMVRGYAIGLGAGTQLLTHLPWVLIAGKPGELARALLMLAGWVINLAVAEWALRRRPRRRPRRPTRPAGAETDPRALVGGPARPASS